MNRFSFFALIVAMIISSWTFAASRDEVATYEKKMIAHREDLTQIAPNVSSELDKEIAISLIDLTTRASIQLTHIQDLLAIDSLVQNEADRERIKPVISTGIRSVANGIDSSIDDVNRKMGFLKNQPCSRRPANLKRISGG